MILVLTITTELLEAALYETGSHWVVKDYHDILVAVSKLEAQMKNGARLTGIAAIIGPVSFTRHRQTIALVNTLAVLRNIPVLALEYLNEKPNASLIAKTIIKLTKISPAKPLVPHYRAVPTITLKK